MADLTLKATDRDDYFEVLNEDGERVGNVQQPMALGMSSLTLTTPGYWSASANVERYEVERQMRSGRIRKASYKRVEARANSGPEMALMRLNAKIREMGLTPVAR